MDDLFKWMQNNREKVHPLILSSIFHYKFVFIHPFSDGNGRMARIWQTTILTKWKQIFQYVPIENLIKKNQQEYYDTISECNVNGNSNVFIEFMLKMIDDTLGEMIKNTKSNIRNVKNNFDLNETEEVVFKFIKKNKKVSSENIANNIDKSVRTARRITSKLIKIGLIEWTGKSDRDPQGKYKCK